MTGAVVCLEILCRIETGQLISNLNQLSGFNVITEIYDYDYNFYWKLFSNRLYLFGRIFFQHSSEIYQPYLQSFLPL